MPELSWRDAITNVLQGRAEPMRYTDIAEAISEQALRTEIGATPATSVNATISLSLQNEGEHSPFMRTGRGYYSLRTRSGMPLQPQVSELTSEEPAETGLINAFGMYWARLNVLWSSPPKILGRQQPGSTPVDFCDQRGVYLLHDGRAVVYVGRTTDQPLGIRLRQHIIDRLKGRWDRFSWFGVYSVTESGALNANSVGNYNLDMLIVTMEALLVEGLEPPQNRKRGDDFKGVEFLQVEDESIKRRSLLQALDELKNKI